MFRQRDLMKMILSAVLSLLLVYGASGDIATINDAVDQLLDSAKEVLRAKGQDKFAISNLDKIVDKKIFGNVHVHGEFHASGGVFQDATSIHRTGDVTMETQGNRVTLSASMGLGQLEVNFGHYSFSLLAIHSEGSIHAACSTNSINAVISVVRQGNQCSVELQRAQIVALGGFDVKLDGPGDINKLVNLLAPWLLNHFNDLIRAQVNKHLEDALRQAMKNVNICDKIPF